jgi:hypothetical protein
MTENTLLATIIPLLAPIVPIVFLILGGQYLLDRYDEKKKNKEQQLELLRAVREKQYEAVENLYHLFSLFMALYREINSLTTNLSDEEAQKGLLMRAISAESEVDALILRIGCEFAIAPTTELEKLLHDLRYSVQVWRRALSSGEVLPFSSSEQGDYVKFKESFARTASYMVEHIHQQLEPSKTQQDQAASLLIKVFRHNYEFYPYARAFHRIKVSEQEWQLETSGKNENLISKQESHLEISEKNQNPVLGQEWRLEVSGRKRILRVGD